MLAHLVSLTTMYHIFEFSFTLLVLSVVALSSTNKVLHFKPKNEYFLQISDIYFKIMF